MLERLQDHLRAQALIPQSARVLVGYSGGADSTCLLHALNRLGYDIAAAHLHHGLRSEADEELERCRTFADRLGIPFVAGKAEVALMSRELKMSVEDAGRQARYAFFRRAQAEVGANLTATAHTKTDSVETIILNLCRGTGPAGLTGVPMRRGDIVRPLLPFDRDEIRAYCLENELWFHDDPANNDFANRRVRVRLGIAPHLREINAQYESNFLRAASILGEEDRFLNGMAAASLEQSETRSDSPLAFVAESVEIELDSTRIGHLPTVLFKRAIRLSVQALGADLDFEQTEQIAREFAITPGSVTAEGGRVAVLWDVDRLIVRDVTPMAPFRHPLTLPGETYADEFGWMITAFHTDLPQDTPIPPRNTLGAVFAADDLKGPLYFRNHQSGDLMQPAGFNGRRKLADLLSETKLSLAIRQRLPVVCDLIGPIWVPGVCYDERIRSTSKSRTGLHLSFGPIPSNASHN